MSRCLVPQLKGLRLRKTRRTLTRANCRLGAAKIKGRRRTARVVAQRPAAGKVRAAGTHVRVKLASAQTG